ncbi:MAG: hypothetical protein DIU62_003100 [Pseudomonadota bacterium]
MSNQKPMRFSTRLMQVMTPIGLIIGLEEAWRLAGGLVAIIAAQVALTSLAAWALVRRLREERNP